MVPLLVIALIMGVSIFAVIASTVQTAGGAPAGTPGAPAAPASPGGAPGAPGGLSTPDLFLLVDGLLTVMGVGMFFAGEAIARRQARKSWEQRRDDQHGEESVAGILLTTTILRAAPLEGAALFAGVIVLLHKRFEALAIVGLAVALMALLLPARSRFNKLLAHARGEQGSRSNPYQRSH